MPNPQLTKRIWGSPRTILEQEEERKVSWLELFYDLVYVVAISKITGYYLQHETLGGFIDYIYLFGIVFWGWLNGSLYHDYTGNLGVRSRFITLFQMLLVAVLIICLSSPPEVRSFRVLIAIMLLQLYGTYIWFSLNYYDKTQRDTNRPYLICFLSAFVLQGLTLFFLTDGEANHPPHVLFLLFTSLVLNFLPHFFAIGIFRRKGLEITISASMLERLGLLMTIVFGEVIVSIINGTSEFTELGADAWTLFVLSSFITFVLWWIFFDLLGTREGKKGFLMMTLIELSYIPALMILGMIAVSFHELFHLAHEHQTEELAHAQRSFGFRVSLFLLSVLLITAFLEFRHENRKPALELASIIIVSALSIAALGYFLNGLSLAIFLACVLGVLFVVIGFIVRGWLVYGEAQHEKI